MNNNATADQIKPMKRLPWSAEMPRSLSEALISFTTVVMLAVATPEAMARQNKVSCRTCQQPQLEMLPGKAEFEWSLTTEEISSVMKTILPGIQRANSEAKDVTRENPAPAIKNTIMAVLAEW